MAERHVAVALSGGGHRASAFALGVILYLARAEKTPEISSVASVSGGSLANGALAQDVDLSTASVAEVESAVARTARKLTGRGTLFGAPAVGIWAAGLVVLGLVGLAGPWLLPLSIWLKVPIFVLAVAFVGWYFAQRGWFTGRAFARTLFTPSGTRTALADVHTGVDHVICATDLHAGEHVYFSGDFVYAYRFGLGGPGDLPLHSAVQASAAFPGVFPVAWIKTARFNFQGGTDGAGASWLALHDGGVYDNMGDQWAHGLANRSDDHPGVFQSADELVVANGSGGLEYGSVSRLGIPWIGEFLTLLQDKSVLYDNGNSVRRRELVARFDLAEREGEGLRGSLVHIPQSPYKVPRAFESSAAWPERAERARAALAHLQQETAETEADWVAIAKANTAVPTTLLGLKVDVTARLLRHAYVLAMVNLHVILGYPLRPIPSAEDFEHLVTSS
jgi:predicted acylesterase/phospholipase RssA